jgi:hypothetical protein
MLEAEGEDAPKLEAEIEAYVLMSSLSPELRALVKKEMFENAPGREEILETVHPDTRAEFEQMKIRHHELEVEIEEDAKMMDKRVEFEVKDSFTGDPDKMAVAIVEKRLGRPIPSYIGTSPEALGDILLTHGLESLEGIADVIGKEIAVNELVSAGVDREEAVSRIFGPLEE